MFQERPVIERFQIYSFRSLRGDCNHHQERQQKLILPQVKMTCAEKTQNFSSYMCNSSVDFHYTEDIYNYVLEKIWRKS